MRTLEISSFLVVTPGYINGTQSWKMELFKAVWMAEEVSAPGAHVAEIYETDKGVKYSRYNMPSEELIKPILRFRWNG